MFCCNDDYTVKDNNFDRNTLTPPGTKFSFKSKGAVHTTSTMPNSPKNTPDSYYQYGSRLQSDNLESQYSRLLQQQRNLNQFVQRVMIPLENQVIHYEKQVTVRQTQLNQLQNLLNSALNERTKIMYNHQASVKTSNIIR